MTKTLQHVICFGGEWLFKILGAADCLQWTQVNCGSSFASRHHMACKAETFVGLMEPSTDPYLVGVAVDVRTAFDETQPGRVCMVSLHMLVCVCI